MPVLLYPKYNGYCPKTFFVLKINNVNINNLTFTQSKIYKFAENIFGNLSFCNPFFSFFEILENVIAQTIQAGVECTASIGFGKLVHKAL